MSSYLRVEYSCANRAKIGKEEILLSVVEKEKLRRQDWLSRKVKRNNNVDSMKDRLDEDLWRRKKQPMEMEIARDGRKWQNSGQLSTWFLSIGNF